MTDPYRAPGPVDVEPPPEPMPDRCVPASATVCPQQIPAVAIAPRMAVAPGFAKALSAAATLLLLVGSASLAALTWTVTSTLVNARLARDTSTHELAQTVVRAAPAPIPQMREPAPRRPHQHHPDEPPPVPALWTSSMLAALGTPSHQPDVLWKRAEKLAADTGAITLARATIAPHALRGVFDRAHVTYQRGGIRILEAGPRSLEGLMGVQRGDLVTSINGHSLDKPEGALDAYADLVAGRSAVVELVRGGKLVALRIDPAG